jgi:hypothetical protein
LKVARDLRREISVKKENLRRKNIAMELRDGRASSRSSKLKLLLGRSFEKRALGI